MLAIINAEQIEAVVAEEREAAGQLWQLINIGKQIENPVTQFVAHGQKPAMDNLAVIET
jgi:hypothetical protein